MDHFVYQGAKTSQISFPLGGIGSGCIGLAGNGRLIDWESFDELLGATYIKYMRSPNFDLLERAQVYRNSPTGFQTGAYPHFITAVTEHAKQRGFKQSIDSLFPPPPAPETDGANTAGTAPTEQAPAGRETIERK